MDIDLICSGTGGTFLSMAGAYKALLESGYKVKRVACTSGSSITMSFLLGMGWDISKFIGLCYSTDFSELISRHLWYPITKKSVFDHSKLYKWILDNTGKACLKDKKLVDVFAVNATDIDTKESIVFSNLNCPDMYFADAILSTISIPGIFPPHKFLNRYLVDGGVTQNLLIGIFDDIPERKKIALMQVDEQQYAKANISYKLRQFIDEGKKAETPNILKIAGDSVSLLIKSCTEAYLNDAKNTKVIKVPAFETKHPFYLSLEEKKQLYYQSYLNTIKNLKEL